jgi:hypothetical protein
VPEIVGQVNRGHAATPELALEPVAVGQAHFGSCSRRFCHQSSA